MLSRSQRRRGSYALWLALHYLLQQLLHSQNMIHCAVISSESSFLSFAVHREVCKAICMSCEEFVSVREQAGWVLHLEGSVPYFSDQHMENFLLSSVNLRYQILKVYEISIMISDVQMRSFSGNNPVLKRPSWKYSQVILHHGSAQHDTANTGKTYIQEIGQWIPLHPPSFPGLASSNSLIGSSSVKCVALNSLTKRSLKHGFVSLIPRSDDLHQKDIRTGIERSEEIMKNT